MQSENPADPFAPDAAAGVLTIGASGSQLTTFLPGVHDVLPMNGNRMFAIFAGLIPCPLTFFVMTFAALHGVVEAGLAFAVVMLIGVFITLGTLAAAIAFSKQSLSGFFAGEGNFILNLGRSFQVLVGIGFVALAMATVLN